jgi:exosortase
MTDRMRVAPASLLVAALLLVLLGALFAPTLAWLWRSWQAHPYYSHGPLLPPLALWFAWRARAGLAAGRPSSAGLGLVLLGVGLHLVALRWAAHPLSAAALVATLLGLVLAAGGRPALSAALVPAGLLALAIPLPLVERLAPPLAAAVARGAALAAGSIGVGVVQAGAQLAVADGAFTVGAPCSGLRSLVALATLAYVVANVLEGPRVSRLALVAFAAPLALVANWARLTGLLWTADTFGTEAGLAFFHGPASPVLFVLAVAALLQVGRALGCDVPPAR